MEMPELPKHRSKGTFQVSTFEPAPAPEGSFRGWYVLVLGALAAEVLFFTYLTHLFS